jgi:hypothetical protein
MIAKAEVAQPMIPNESLQGEAHVCSDFRLRQLVVSIMPVAAQYLANHVF